MKRAAGTFAIVNPVAGNGRAGRAWPALAARLREAGVAFRQCVTCGPGDGATCARAALAEGVDRIVVVGGDGTLNEVVNGLLAFASADVALPALALLPVGTGADFARGLGIGDVEEGLAALSVGRARPIDAGRATFLDDAGEERTRFFVNVADCGLGPETSTRIGRGPKRAGTLAYLYGALGGIAGYHATNVRVEIDGALAYAGPSGLVAVANGTFFGGGMCVAPKARPDDSLLDAVILGPTSRRALATELLPRVYRGTHLRHPAVHFGRGAAVTITAARPFPLELDGEIVGTTPARLGVLPRALRLLVPPARWGTSQALAGPSCSPAPYPR